MEARPRQGCTSTPVVMLKQAILLSMPLSHLGTLQSSALKEKHMHGSGNKLKAPAHPGLDHVVVETAEHLCLS